MESYIKNNRELKKLLLQKIKNINEYTLKVVNYTSLDDEMIITDLEVEIFLGRKYIDCVNCYNIESTGEFDIEVDKHRQGLRELKKKVYEYLKLHFENVEFLDDYTQ